MNKNWQPQTRAIRGQMDQTQYGEHSTPLFLTSSFTFDSAEDMAATFAGEREGIIYSRYSNPSVDELIAKACALEGTEAGFATASGMAAVFASLAALVKQGDHIVATRALFGSTHQVLTNILSKWGVTFTYVEPDQPETWPAAVQDNTVLFCTETPSNPGLKLVDLEAAGKLCKEHGLLFVVDNCFATPVLQRPADFGADLITHSVTKWMDGQGRVLGGLLLGTQEVLDRVVAFCRHTGPAMSPFNAWTISKSLETLHLRMDAHDTRTILTHPATTTHSKLTPEERALVGISDGLVRMSVGLEAVVDIQEDLLRGL